MEERQKRLSEDRFEVYKYEEKLSIVGYHPKSGSIDTIPRTKPIKKLKLGPSMTLDYTREAFIAKLREKWIAKEPMKCDGMEMIVDPFQLCIFDNFLDNSDFVDSIREDFNEVKWAKRNMDLYEFFQSQDLKHIDLDYIGAFYDFMKGTVMNWMKEVTGYDLVELSATCSCYTNTDYLLVHDDQRENRMVAFVYYLTRPEGWDSSKGGTLDLLSKDGNELPSNISKSILPRNNRLIIFPVTNDSYHQVAEVTTIEDTRLTINGWFHARIPPDFKIPHFEYPENSLLGPNKMNPQETGISLESWINNEYLNNDDGTLEDIQRHIEENSEISLSNFFRNEVWMELNDCLKSLENEEKWRVLAPPNRSLYEVLSLDDMPSALKGLLQMFKAEEFFAYLKIITELDLKTMKFEFQKWTVGSFCLLSDYEWNKTQELDIIVYFPLDQAGNIIGGRIQYVNPEEEIQEALITIDPSENTLNLVYRDTARFTKYFSKQSKCKKFYILICSYSE